MVTPHHKHCLLKGSNSNSNSDSNNQTVSITRYKSSLIRRWYLWKMSITEINSNSIIQEYYHLTSLSGIIKSDFWLIYRVFSHHFELLSPFDKYCCSANVFKNGICFERWLKCFVFVFVFWFDRELRDRTSDSPKGTHSMDSTTYVIHIDGFIRLLSRQMIHFMFVTT